MLARVLDQVCGWTVKNVINAPQRDRAARVKHYVRTAGLESIEVAQVHKPVCKGSDAGEPVASSTHDLGAVTADCGNVSRLSLRRARSMGMKTCGLGFFSVLLVAALLLNNAPAIMASGLVNLSAIRIVNRWPVETVTGALSRARAVRPKDIRPARLVGQLLYQKGDYVDAIRVLSGVCETQPSDFLAMLWLGLSYDKLGRDADALRCFSSGRRAPYLVMLGDQAAHADKEKWYMLAAQADPGSQSAALSLAHLYGSQERTDEARQWYLRAIELSPNNAQTYLRLAILVFRQLHDREQAERYLRCAIEVAPDQIDAYMWLGHIAYTRGEPVTAIEWYRRATEVAPSSAWARWFLGARLCDTREYEAGIRQLEYALSRDAKDAIAYYELGRCYLRQGSFDQAAEAFTAAIRFGTIDFYLASSHEGPGDVYLAQGNLSEAARQYQSALTFDPANANLARKLSDLENPGE